MIQLGNVQVHLSNVHVSIPELTKAVENAIKQKLGIPYNRLYDFNRRAWYFPGVLEDRFEREATPEEIEIMEGWMTVLSLLQSSSNTSHEEQQ